MKTAISIPDELFRQTDDMARRMHKSRSRLVAEALGEYVARHDPPAVTSQLDQVVEGVGQAESELASAAAHHVLAHTDW